MGIQQRCVHCEIEQTVADSRISYYSSDIEGKEALLIVEKLSDGSTASVKLLKEECEDLFGRMAQVRENFSS